MMTRAGAWVEAEAETKDRWRLASAEADGMEVWLLIGC